MYRLVILPAVPLPAKTAETLNADSNQTSTANLEEDELEEQDDEDGASETNGADEFGIDAAVRQTERDADLAEIADATPDDQRMSGSYTHIHVVSG
jgi:hypothetical protein